jgi:hypothetical protein
MRPPFSGGVFAAIVLAIGAAAPQASRASQTPAETAPSTPAAAAVAAAPTPAPSARVGRISLVLGKVELRGPGESAWSPASVNDPVATGVALRADPQARAEIRIGADMVDLDGGAEIAVARLDQPSAEIAVRQGRIDLDIRRLGVGEKAQVDIARGGVWLLLPGRYDVDAGGSDRPVRIAAFTGSARFAGGSADIPINAGDRVVFSAAGPIIPMTEPASGDEFAEWCGARAVVDSKLAAPYFVSREMTGYAALDAAGSWRVTGKNGEVWTPKAPPADWAPYRNGHWRWLAPWGWSWVDDQPWGFATSHYGRWLFADRRWSWAPGMLTPHPVWAPAVVAFLGTPGVGLSYADGPGPAIAWFPLAPGEIYWPSYTGDLDYFRAGRPVAGALVTIPDERLRNAPAIMGSPQVGPPPPPVRVAAAPVHEHPPVAPNAAKGGNWVGIVRAATIRSQHFQEVARARVARLRIATYAEVSRLRHTLVLRVARADHPALPPETRKRVIRR